MVALRGQSTWRVSVIHVYLQAFADASNRRECLGTRHSSFLHIESCVYISVQTKGMKIMTEGRMTAIIDVVRRMKNGAKSAEEALIKRALEGVTEDVSKEDRVVAERAFALRD